MLGEYAVAVYDKRERRLVITHDAIGIVPCFFSVQQRGVIAGSHLEDVVRAARADMLDEEYVADHLSTGRPSTGRTPHRAVRRLMPGRTVTCDDGRTREHTTWELGNIAPLRLASDADYEERCRELIADGVRAALDTDRVVWAELSGGLDSSTIVSAAAALCDRALPVVSMVYERSATADERPWMQAVVDRFGVPWHQLDCDLDAPFAELPSRTFAEPNATMPVGPLYRRHDELLARHGAGVVLCGLGGDQVFAGDSPEPRHLADPLWRLDPAGLVRGVCDWKERSPARRSMLHWLWGNVVRPSVRHLRGWSVTDDASASFTVPDWIAPEFARRADLRGRLRRRYAPRCAAVGDQYFAEALYVVGTIAGTHRDLLAERFDYRYPLLHRPLAEFMYAVPWEQRLQPDCTRSLQRRALRGVLPEKIRRRRNKGGVQQSYVEGFRRGGDWLAMLLRRPQIVERGYVDARRWSEAVEQARFGRMHTMRHIVLAVTLECWLNHRDPTTTTASISSQGATDEREILYHA